MLLMSFPLIQSIRHLAAGKTEHGILLFQLLKAQALFMAQIIEIGRTLFKNVIKLLNHWDIMYLLFKMVAGARAQQQQNQLTRNMGHQQHVWQTAKEGLGPIMFMRSIRVHFSSR